MTCLCEIDSRGGCAPGMLMRMVLLPVVAPPLSHHVEALAHNPFGCRRRSRSRTAGGVAGLSLVERDENQLRRVSTPE